MVIVPREKPVMQHLNSYYLDIEKLMEHFRGELGAGAIHFHSASAEGVVFFDKDEILSSVYRDKDEEIDGEEAIDRLVNSASQQNFTVNVYEINPERIYFWSNMKEGETIYHGLSTEFTDLQGLIKKMMAEKLTGYIDVSIGEGSMGGLLFFNNGQPVGGSYSWGGGEINGSQEGRNRLIEESKRVGGVCDVIRIPMSKIGKEEAAKAGEKSKKVAGGGASLTTEALGEPMSKLEGLVASSKRIKSDFGTLLKKKFVEKAETYPFLDPFAGEFFYAGGKISFEGKSSEESLFRGVLECVKELAEELDLTDELRRELESWTSKYDAQLRGYGLSI